MKLTIALLFLSSTFAPTHAPAQISAATQAAHDPKPYRLTYTLTETDGGKVIGVQHYTLVVIEGGRTTLKNGSKIPVATGSYTVAGGAPGSAQTQFTYLDVGINLDSTLVDEVNNMWRLRAKLEQSSVAEQKSLIAGVEEPVVRQSVLELSTSIAIGKPQILGTLDLTGTTRHLQVEVVLEPVK